MTTDSDSVAAAHRGRRYLVTGAASGIGKEVSQRLVRMGARVALVDRDADRCADVAAEVDAGASRTIAIVADVTTEPQVEQMVERALEAFGGLDGAFNNAGTAAHGSYRFGTPLTEVSADGFRALYEVNALGVFLCLKHQIRHLVGGEASLVVNASVAGLAGVANRSPYVASKHAAVGLVKSAALETAGTGIRVNAVCPGFVETPMLGEGSTTEMREARARAIPIRRLAAPGEVAALVCWLLSSESSYLTGATIAADGGISAGVG